MLPYSGQISYGQIRDEFGGTGTFDLQNAYNGTYGALNSYSYIQPTNPGGANYSPNQWYGYNGYYIYSTGLVHCWDAWPTIGSYPGSGSTIYDTAGSTPSATGVMYNGTGWANLNGGYWVFDGVNDYVDGGPAYTTYTNQLTVDVWIRWDSGTTINAGQGVGQGVYNNFDSPGTNMWLMHGNSGNTLTIYAWDSPTGVTGGATTSTLTMGNWYNLIGVVNSAGSSMYVNGTLTGTGGGFGGGNMWSNPGATLFMGGDLRYDFRRMNGTIAALHVYNIAFTQTEVNQNFNALRSRFTL
jgi:hypothetical protein